MITKATGYQSSDGTFHATLEDAQESEIVILLGSDPVSSLVDLREEIAAEIVKHKAKVMDILTTTHDSRPKARKINGATRTRKPKHIAAQNTLPLDTTEPPRAA